MFGGLAGTIVQGIGFGAGSAVAHRAVDSLMGPRQVEHGVAHTEAEPRVVFVLGGPESGKGTQCAKVVENYGFEHLSAGDLLHAEINSGSENGTMIQNMIKEGKIVPSEVTVKLIQKAMEQSKTDKFLIDGFPQNKENRATFESVTGIAPEFILFFDCLEDEMERRLLQRNQGHVDDNIETIRKRFKVFLESSLPVVEYYESIGKVRKINATRSVEEIFDSIQPLFKPFVQDDLLQVSQRLLDGIDRADYEVYRLFDEVACFMREDARKVVWEAAIEDIFEHSCSFTPEKLTSSGVRDPDDPRKERLSPLLKLLFDENVSYLDMNRQGERYFQNSPVKLLEDVWDHHGIFAGSVLRLQGADSGQEGRMLYGSGFGVSSTVVLTAAHNFLDSQDRAVTQFLGLPLGARDGHFRSRNRPHFFLHVQSFNSELFNSMSWRDPMSSMEMATKLSLDAGTLNIGKPLLSLDKQIRSLKEFFIPMSVTMEAVNIRQQPACYVLSFPMVNDIRTRIAGVRNGTVRGESLMAFFLGNIGIVSDEVVAALGGRTRWTNFAARMDATDKVSSWLHLICDKLSQLLEDVRDGDLVPSPGRILAANDTLLAHSASVFHGSSGGVLCLTENMEGCFVGLHISPGERGLGNWTKPAYNLCVNVEHPAFGILYVDQILPTLPPAASSFWESHKERRCVLLRFLAYHFGGILEHCKGRALIGEQLNWLLLVAEDIGRKWPYKDGRLFPDLNELVTPTVRKFLSEIVCIQLSNGEESFLPVGLECVGLPYKTRSWFELIRIVHCICSKKDT